MTTFYQDFAGPHRQDYRKSDKYMPSFENSGSYRATDQGRWNGDGYRQEAPTPKDAALERFGSSFNSGFTKLRLGSQELAFKIFESQGWATLTRTDDKTVKLEFEFPKHKQADRMEKILLVVDVLLKTQHEIILPMINTLGAQRRETRRGQL